MSTLPRVPITLALLRLAPLNIVLPKIGWNMVASRRLAPEKLASSSRARLRYARCKLAPVKLAPRRSAPKKLVLTITQWVKSLPLKFKYPRSLCDKSQSGSSNINSTPSCVIFSLMVSVFLLKNCCASFIIVNGSFTKIDFDVLLPKQYSLPSKSALIEQSVL